ncbi:MAG TPA: alanine racemase [Acetobacteraceae bacterium]|nr:alanine racemase [Acetobacteraceae bacterium]
MRLADLPTPCLVLDRRKLDRNLERMAAAVARQRVALRPHMKTAKSIEVARLALKGQPGGITVSTLAEARYFAGHGIADMIYAVGITPAKLDAVAALNAAGASVKVITDDPAAAAAIASHPGEIRALVEVDCGEHRGGMAPDDARLLEVAARLGRRLAGVLTHAGHSYAGRRIAEMAEIAEQERATIVAAARLLREAGHAVEIVSMGSSPTALHAEHLDGVTEVRAGVYMFGDLFQSEILTHAQEDIAVTVLASVIGLRPHEQTLLIDAGGLALSKDRSTQAAPVDYGFGLVVAEDGSARLGRSVVRTAYQEHGVVACDEGLPFPMLRVGDRVRVAPNHVCMTAAAYDRYYVVAGSDRVVAEWDRVNGW